MIGIVVLLALVGTFVWRVWLQHEKAGRYVEEPEVVRLDRLEKNSYATP